MTNPGDNSPPRVSSVGYLAYDDKFFYAAFEFDDPDPRADPRAVRRPRPHQRRHTDYGGVILDTRNDGRTAVLLLATPRGIQYDAVTDDAAGEDSSPDFFWESAARITERGWTLEIRIPFSSLRYRNARSADVGHPALPQLSARLPLPDLLSAAAARRQLLHLPRRTPGRARGLPTGGHIVRGAVRHASDGEPSLRPAWFESARSPQARRSAAST